MTPTTPDVCPHLVPLLRRYLDRGVDVVRVEHPESTGYSITVIDGVISRRDVGSGIEWEHSDTKLGIGSMFVCRTCKTAIEGKFTYGHEDRWRGPRWADRVAWVAIVLGVLAALAAYLAGRGA